MITSDPIVAGAEALAAIKAYLRVEHADDDATLTALTDAALAECEETIGQVVIVRAFTETAEVGSCWVRLSRRPVTAIVSVARVDGEPLGSGDYESDIGCDGVGLVRLTLPGLLRLSVSYRAGLASGWSAIPEPLRQGIVLRAAEIYAARDTAPTSPSTEVQALWRGSRRLRLI